VEEKDSAERRASTLTRNIALALLNRRLGLLARQEGAEIVGGRAQESRMLDFLRVATLDVGCREAASWRQCLATGEQELRRALEHGFQDAELREIVANVRNQLEQGVRMAEARTSPQLAEGLLNAIIGESVFTSPAANRTLLEPVLQKLTVDDCLAALRELFGQEVSPYLFVAGNLQLQEQDIMAAYQASLRQPVDANEEAEAAQFAYDTAGEPGEVVSRREVEDLGLTLLRFGNDVRLNLKPTTFEPGRIHVNVRVGGGVLTAPQDKPGLPTLVGRSFISGGLGQHSVEQLSTILAGRNVGYRFSIGGDAFELSGSTTPDDLPLQLQVLQAFITDPGYRPDALREFREGLDRMYTELSHAISGPQNTKIAQLMSGGDPRFGLPEQAMLEQRDLDEARAWLDPQLARGPLEISIVGDLDAERTIAAVARTFGALPQREPKPAYTAERRVSYPDKPVSRRYAVPTELPRGLVDMRWPVTDGRDVPLARRIGLLTSVFSDRLRVRLREEMGQAYSPSVRQQLSDVFPGYGFIVAGASVAPEQARAVADTIRAVAADMAANGVTEDELRRAREPLMTQVQQSLQHNGYWLGGVISGVQEFPQRLDWHRSRQADFLAIGVEEINALARQYLQPQRAFEFIMLPEKKDGAAREAAAASK
jgi:zinc protease